MTIDRTHLVTVAPAGAAILIVVLGWALFVRPVSAQASRDARTLIQLRQRATAVRNSLSQPVPAPAPVDSAGLFRRQVTGREAVPALMEQLARLAARDGALNLAIETGERAIVPAASRSGPQVTGATQVDPRLALFDLPLAYMPITMSFDADYAKLGDLLWHLRDLATLVEVRSLVVKPFAPESPSGARDGGVATTPAFSGAGGVEDHPPATLHASLTLFAYSAQENGARVPAVVAASNAPGVAP